MIVTFIINRPEVYDMTPTMLANIAGESIGLPYEIVSMGDDFERVQLTIEIADDMICDGIVEDPFNI